MVCSGTRGTTGYALLRPLGRKAKIDLWSFGAAEIHVFPVADLAASGEIAPPATLRGALPGEGEETS